ncbi:uncharacterized protein LOC143913534 [Arctopsyche grandis]|uniref:uncharacterized protein LOC143913534 n=1 Tax=Arctopsyche grandis TaxID=121162 RepID=UPI00406D730B
MTNFPDKYRYKVDSISDDGLSVKLFAGIHDIDNCVEWVSLYAQLTNSRWIVSQSRDDGGKYVCRKLYRCQFSSTNKKLKKRNFDCLASISIIVKFTNKYTRYRYQHVKENLPAIITINLQHSHDTESAKALTSLAPSSETFDRFQFYFHSQMSVAEAIRRNAAFLKEEFGDVNKLMVNANYNPKPRTVAYWHEKWRKKHLSDTTASGMIKENLPAIITINLQHSHDTESGKALTSLAPSSDTFDRFQFYFQSQMSVAEAIRRNAAFLKEQFGDVDKLMVNADYNPKPRKVAYWHEKWRKKHLSDTTAVLPSGDKADTTEFYNAFENNPNSEHLSFSSSTTNQQLLSSSVFVELLPCTSECIHNINAPVRDDQEILNSDRETIDKLIKNLPIYHFKKLVTEIEKCKNPSDYIAIVDAISERKLIRKHYRAPINVQPTAVARRRSGVTKGNKRLISGRPVLVGVQKKKKDDEICPGRLL